MCRVEKAAEIAIRFATKALEMAEAVKDGRGDDEYMFGRDLRHDEIPFWTIDEKRRRRAQV